MPSTTPVLLSVCVGIPESLGVEGAAAWHDEPWTTGIFKAPVDGPVFARADGIDGDGQADRSAHGGPDKAICAYSAEHYPSWRDVTGLGEISWGAFGENFTVGGLTEDSVCIGDVWAVAGVVVQVSQPRQPCWKLARKWRIRTLTDQVVTSGRTGWYFRVLREGIVAAGAPLSLVERPHPAWTIAAANGVMHRGVGDIGALASLEPLSQSWKLTLARRLAGR
jgi:MOSC domain-containing protein YiiM